MNHAAAKASIEALFVGRPQSRGALRAHLDGCAECRAHYDQTARTFRALAGKPDEMTAEELWLFEPIFPAAAPSRFRVPALVVSALALAACAVLVVYVRGEPEGEFGARGQTPVADKPAVRALCTHAVEGKTVVSASCGAGDTLAFVGSGKGAVAVVVDGRTVVTANVSAPDTVLPQTLPFAPGLKVFAVTGTEDKAAAEACAQGSCGSGLERTEVTVK